MDIELGANSFNSGTLDITEPGRRLLESVEGQTAPQSTAQAHIHILTKYRMFYGQTRPGGIVDNDWRLAALGAVAASDWPAIGEPDDATAIQRCLVLLDAMKAYGETMPAL